MGAVLGAVGLLASVPGVTTGVAALLEEEGATAAGAEPAAVPSVAAAVEYADGLVGEGGRDETSDEDFLSSSKRLESLCLRPAKIIMESKVMIVVSIRIVDCLRFTVCVILTSKDRHGCQ